MDYGQFKSWIETAPPQDLTTIVKFGLSRIATLPQEHRDRFFAEVKGDPNIARLFEKTTV